MEQFHAMKQRAAAKAAAPDLNTTSSVLNQLAETETFIQKLVALYTDLIKYTSQIVATKCANLRAYILDLRGFYFLKVKSILSRLDLIAVKYKFIETF